MSANYLNSDLGLFTYYIDDSLYNYFNTIPDYTFFVSTEKGLTAEGEKFFNTFNVNSFYASLLCTIKPTASFVNFLNSYFPKILYKTGAAQNTVYTFYNNEQQFKTDTSIDVTPILYNTNEIRAYNGSNNTGFIYGHEVLYSTSDLTSGEATFFILAFKSDFSDFALLAIHAVLYKSDPASTTYTFKQIYSRTGRLANNSYRTDFINYFKKMKPDPKPPVKPTDPYTNGGNSSGGGGGGTFGGGNTIFGGASDSIDIPALPTASASAAGFITLFNPSLSQLNNLASYMWSDLFSLETFKKIFADPMDCILGLSIVPVKPASAGTSTVKIGNVSTDVSMNKTSSQYVVVDCGTIDVKEYWGGYLDYAPYTQCEIYLPYVGTKQISVDDVMNKAVHVVYHVDILSGACNAYVKCGDSVLYTFVGQCSSSIPISGNDWTNVLNGAISVAGKIGLAIASGGATALMSGLGAASSIISSSKPAVERSGAMSSTGGLLGIQKPYLILTRPKQALPENQNKYTGYPSFITMALSDCTGYTEIDSVHLENMSCTDEEAQEIENLLKSGVIF